MNKLREKMMELSQLLAELFYAVGDDLADAADELSGHGFKTFKAWVRVLAKCRCSLDNVCVGAYHEAYTLRGYKTAFQMKSLLTPPEYEKEYLIRVNMVQRLVNKSLKDGGIPLPTPEKLLAEGGDCHITPYTPLMWYTPDRDAVDKLGLLYNDLAEIEQKLKQDFFDVFGKMSVARNASVTFDIVHCAQSACSVVTLGGTPIVVVPWERLENMNYDLLLKATLNYLKGNKHWKNINQSVESEKLRRTNLK